MNNERNSLNVRDDLATNPYAAPADDPSGRLFDAVGDGFPRPESITQEQAEQIRRANLKHEASVRSIGLLYYLGGSFGIFGTLGGLIELAGMFTRDVAAPVVPPSTGEIAESVAGVVLASGLTFLNLLIGWGVRRLKPWSRIATIVLTSISLLFFGFGVFSAVAVGVASGVAVSVVLSIFLIMPIYILWLMHSAKGRIVFSPTYKVVRSMTPEIKYRTSIIIKIAGGLLLALIVFGFIVSVLAQLRP